MGSATDDTEDLTPSQGQKIGAAAQRYASLTTDRENYLRRARRLSRLTINYLFRELGSNSTTDEILPWQALGAQGVNNLAAKLVLSMFPSGVPFINLRPDRKFFQGLAKLDPDTRGKLKAVIDKGLSKVEQEFVEACEEDGDRAVHFETALHLLVGGNHCEHVCEDGTVRGLHLERYVVVRDRQGNLLEAVIEEPMAYQSLEPDIQAMVRAQGYGPKDPQGKVDWTIERPSLEPISVYTHMKLIRGSWRVYDEVMSQVVPRSEATYPKDRLPWLFLCMFRLHGEAYGRSYCETYEADLQTYDAIWQTLTEGGAVIAKMVQLVKPGSTINKKDLAEAANGDVLTGDPEDMAFIRADKGGDLDVVMEQATAVEGRLKLAFCMDSAVERSGERVTATEINRKALELDTTLGGVYSNQVTTWQKPYAEIKMFYCQKKKRVTKLPEGTTKMTILTGDAGLGRLQKAQALEEFLGAMLQLFPQQFAQYVQVGNAMERSAANRSVDTDGLVKSDDQVQQEAAAAQQQALSQQVAPNVVQAGGKILQDQMAPQQGAPPQGAPTDQSQQQPTTQGA